MPNQSKSIPGPLLQRQVSFRNSKTYSTLNTLTDTTRNVWIAFHGMGQLSRNFLRCFSGLAADENYVIAPQAPSKYYLNNSYTQVGASWLTREDIPMEIENNLTYLDAVFQAESLPATYNLMFFAYSQGVSIATRWMASRRISCKGLILYAGTVPDELTPSDFSYLNPETTIRFVVGDQDEFINGARRENEKDKLERLFNGKVEHLIIKGGHSLNKNIINSLI